MTEINSGFGMGSGRLKGGYFALFGIALNAHPEPSL